MMVHASHRNHVSHAVEREASRLLLGEPDDGCPGDEPDEDAAEICRMIELCGMIGLECALLEGE
jgi:hypothetical protein